MQLQKRKQIRDKQKQAKAAGGSADVVRREHEEQGAGKSKITVGKASTLLPASALPKTATGTGQGTKLPAAPSLPPPSVLEPAGLLCRPSAAAADPDGNLYLTCLGDGCGHGLAQLSRESPRAEPLECLIPPLLVVHAAIALRTHDPEAHCSWESYESTNHGGWTAGGSWVQR